MSRWHGGKGSHIPGGDKKAFDAGYDRIQRIKREKEQGYRHCPNCDHPNDLVHSCCQACGHEFDYQHKNDSPQ